MYHLSIQKLWNMHHYSIWLIKGDFKVIPIPQSPESMCTVKVCKQHLWGTMSVCHSDTQICPAALLFLIKRNLWWCPFFRQSYRETQHIFSAIHEETLKTLFWIFVLWYNIEREPIPRAMPRNPWISSSRITQISGPKHVTCVKTIVI